MNRETQIAILDASNARCKEIMLSKSKDYANEDVLSNFKMVAKIEGSTPVKDILGHIANKVVRLGNLLGNDQNPNHESIEDTAHDAINYFHLLIMAIKEAEVKKEYTPNDFTIPIHNTRYPGGMVYPNGDVIPENTKDYTLTGTGHTKSKLEFTAPLNRNGMKRNEHEAPESKINYRPITSDAYDGESVTVNHKTQHDKSNEQIKGILDGFDENSCGRV